jgi:hypothetical protein
MLPEVSIVGNGCDRVRLASSRAILCPLTLLGGQEPQFVRRTAVVWIALSVVPVLENNAKSIELFHEDLYDCTTLATGVSLTDILVYLLPVCRLENRLSPLVSPPMYKNTGPPGL